MILALAGVMTVVASCQNEDLLVPDTPGAQDGYVSVEFCASVPDMDIIRTKTVDPDGEDITGMTLFCFNDRGLFVSTEKAIIAGDGATPSLSGTYKTELPIVTSRIHFVANLHKDIKDADFAGMSESQVLSTLTGSSGMMSYWARVVKGASATIEEALNANNPVILLRDHARITVADKSSTYSDLAFVAVNTNAFGTVAPFKDGEWVAPSVTDPFVTLPESNLKASGITDVVSVASRQYQYVFETENKSEDPVSVIIRGATSEGTKYYRVMLIDEDGNFIPIMRNFTYEVQIVGALDYGQDTFEAALTAPASNNVWISVSDDIKAVSSTEYTLAVRETHIVLGEDDPVFSTIHQQYTVHYSLESLTGSTLTSADVPVITWLDGNNVAQQTMDASEFVISADGKTAEGQIDITLLKLTDGQLKREGTLLIKKGLLERKVKIVTVAKQKFTPAWITTNIYGGETGENVTMMFHIPEDCPEELFPMDVLVSVNDMDVRNASGMVLPIITEGEEGYGEDNGIGYKYVLTVEESGVQRVYLETILSHSTGSTVDVTIEAKHFESLTKMATFKDNTSDRILIHNLRSYVGAMPADEVIYYYLVPQKINARVEFDTHLGRVVDNAPAAGDGISLTDPKGNVTHFKYIPANTDFTTPNVDEFLLYSENLEHNHSLPSGTTYYFDFYHIDPINWSTTAGRVLGLYRNTNASSEMGAKLHLKTNKAKSDEVVRIASNPKGSISVTTGTYGRHPDPKPYASELCTGTGLYKSAVFELATFHPFHFSAQVKAGTDTFGEKEYGQVQPADEDVLLSYVPGQSVNVEFDITSFKSSIQGLNDDEQLSVDPFGTAFEVYIDAPTLELDTTDPTVSSLMSAGKIRVEGTRVVYVVDKDRDTERTYFTGTALSEDTATKDVVTKETIPVPDQTGERKVIPFKTKDIVSAGGIKISSDETKVVYYTKTFKIQNEAIEGFLTYGTGSTPVPSGTFVPFSTNDGTRIGVVTVGDSGSFELRLRAEYEFDWNTTPVKFECKIGENEYKKEFSSLAALFSNTAVNMQ